MNKFRDVKVHSKDVMVKSTYVTKNARVLNVTSMHLNINKQKRAQKNSKEE